VLLHRALPHRDQVALRRVAREKLLVQREHLSS
jgi:hypothetical protein